jgi:hypothetical protein
MPVLGLHAPSRKGHVARPWITRALRALDHEDFRTALALAQYHGHRRTLENCPQSPLARPVVREDMLDLL